MKFHFYLIVSCVMAVINGAQIFSTPSDKLEDSPNYSLANNDQLVFTSTEIGSTNNISINDDDDDDDEVNNDGQTVHSLFDENKNIYTNVHVDDEPTQTMTTRTAIMPQTTPNTPIITSTVLIPLLEINKSSPINLNEILENEILLKKLEKILKKNFKSDASDKSTNNILNLKQEIHNTMPTLSMDDKIQPPSPQPSPFMSMEKKTENLNETINFVASTMVRSLQQNEQEQKQTETAQNATTNTLTFTPLISTPPSYTSPLKLVQEVVGKVMSKTTSLPILKASQNDVNENSTENSQNNNDSEILKEELSWLSKLHQFGEDTMKLTRNTNVYLVFFSQLIMSTIIVFGLVLGLFKFRPTKNYLLHSFLKDFRRMQIAETKGLNSF